MKAKKPSRLVAAAACCLLAPALGHATDSSVAVTSLQLSRPAVLDPFDMPGTTIALDVTLQGKRVLGLGGGSAITTLRDDTGHDLLAEGSTRESEVLAEMTAAMSGMFGGGGSVSRKNTDGNIDHARAASLVDPERNSVQVPVITLGLPAKGAKLLQLQGELEILVAAAGERRVRVDGVTAMPDWFVIEVEVEGQRITCNPADWVETDDYTVAVYMCNGRNLSRVEVVGDAPKVPPGDYGDANLFVLGVAEDLSLDFIFPAQETVRVPVEIEFGVGF